MLKLYVSYAKYNPKSTESTTQLKSDPATIELVLVGEIFIVALFRLSNKMKNFEFDGYLYGLNLGRNKEKNKEGK